jgi:hypothetical protein
LVVIFYAFKIPAEHFAIFSGALMASTTRSRGHLWVVAVWALAALLVSVAFGPSFCTAFYPPHGLYLDFAQEWLAAKNYWTGTPIYAPQTTSFSRHTNIATDGGNVIPWNAHPPASVLLTLPFGQLPYREAHLVWNLVTLCLFLISLWLILRELNLRFQVWWVFPAIVGLLVANPLYIHIMQGQWNLPVLFLLTLAWVADRRDYTSGAGVAVGLATALKLVPGFVFVYFLFAHRWRAVLGGGVAFLAVNLLALGLFGWNEFLTYIYHALPSVTTYETNWRNVSLVGFWLRIFNPQPQERIIPLVLSPALGWGLIFASRLLVIGAVGWVAWRAQTVAKRDRAYAASVVGMVLLSPVAWTHYFVLLALPIALVCVRCPAGLGRCVMWVVIVVLALQEDLLLKLTIGAEQTADLAGARQTPISPLLNLAVISCFAYAVVALFVLVLLTPADENHGQPQRDTHA